MDGVNVDELTDVELRRYAKQYGVEQPGPINDLTRNLYKRMLKKRMNARAQDFKHDVSVKKRRIEDTPPPLPAFSSRRMNRGWSRSPSYSSQQRHRQRRSYSDSQGLSQARKHSDGYDFGYVGNSSSQIDGVGGSSSSGTSLVDHDGMRMSFSSPGVGSSSLGLSQSDSGTILEEDMNVSHGAPTDVPLYPSFSASESSMRESSMDMGVSPNLKRKPIHNGSFGASVSSTVKYIGDGLQKLVNSFLTPSNVSSSSPVPKRNPHTPRGRAYRNQDSIEIGGEIEIERDTVDGNDVVSPEPSAPPHPLEEEGQLEINYDWELLPSDVHICRRPDNSLWQLAKGGFGEVYKGIKDNVDEVAVKVIRRDQTVSIEQFKKEIDLISKLRHRHIVQFYGACVKPHNLYMVTELMQCDLFTALQTDARYLWSGEYGKEVCIGIAKGINYLHSRRPPVVHRDIKSPNILLMDGLAKIADVGIAQTKLYSDMTAQRGFTIAWAAPEVIYRRRATEKIDIWSFGIIMWEIVAGRPPGAGRLTMPNSAPQELRMMFINCTKEDPAQRPAADDILVSLRNME